MKLESVARMLLHRRVVKHPRFSRISPAFSWNKSAAECRTVHPSNHGLPVAFGFPGGAARQGDKKRQDR